MKIAIIGAGISGMLAAYLLFEQHEITVFEAGTRPGGHSNTVDIVLGGQSYAVDTGFVVYNDRTYPGFVRLLDRLGVASRPSAMSFSVRCERTGVEYNGSSIDSLFAQRSNLVRPSFYTMILDILRFNRQARELLDDPADGGPTLGEYLESHRYSRPFVENHLIPMAAAIWSTEPGAVRRFPARRFVQFFENHGALSLGRRPRWKVIDGGSRRYVEALVRPYRERLRLNTPVRSIVRRPDGVQVTPRKGLAESFDATVLAVHSDQALAMLADPSAAEREILGAIPYQDNEAVLHTDTSILPKRRRAWASWNYHVPREARERVAVTYDMNILQGLGAPAEPCVTLNCSEQIDPSKIIQRFVYHHPMYTAHTFVAQRRWDEINGVNRTYYCGAYWGYGFHEDGVRSALAVAEKFGLAL